MRLSRVVFPQPGEYRVQLYSDNQLLREARLELIQLTPPKQPGEQRLIDQASRSRVDVRMSRTLRQEQERDGDHDN